MMNGRRNMSGGLALELPATAPRGWGSAPALTEIIQTDGGGVSSGRK